MRPVSTDDSSALTPAGLPAGRTALDAPDRRDGRVYIMPSDVDLAVEVALATGRPLLLRGEPGSGKSSLAAYVAAHRQPRPWRYYEHVVTSRTQARDLLWTFDSVRRLADAQTSGHRGEATSDSEYVEPGVLWWAFSPESAKERGVEQARSQAIEPNAAVNAGRSPDHAVVLIDEIDKAEPDMPNGLLVPLGSSEFVVAETNQVVRKSAMSSGANDHKGRHLIVITTNEERELPQAFLRRCVTIWLRQPSKERLIEIARAHLTDEGGYQSSDEELMESLADELIKLRETTGKQRMRAPSTAEYLDALRACRSLGVTVGGDDWDLLCNLTLLKPQQPEG